MAEEEQKKTESDPKGSGFGLIHWIIIAVMVVVGAASGFGLGRILAGPASPQAEELAELQKEVEKMQAETEKPQQGKDTGATWYHEMQPVVAFLNEPGATRYIRAVLILKISSELLEAEGQELIKDNIPLLENWLTIYLASLSIDDIRGDKNQKRIQSYILDAFNEKLFPEQKPMIREILFKEFVPQ